MKDETLDEPVVVTEPCGCYTSTFHGVRDHYACAEHLPERIAAMTDCVTFTPSEEAAKQMRGSRAQTKH